MNFRGLKFWIPILIYVLLFASMASATNTASNSKQVQDLQAKIVNLTKENRELKAQLANLTRKLNQLEAENAFLEQQNEEYRQIIQQVMKSESEQNKQSYIEKAKKERLIGSVLLKSLLASLAVVGLVGYGLYRKKGSWEYPL